MQNMDKLTTIQESLREGHLTNDPHGCAEAKAQLAGEYSFWSGIISEIEIRKPKEWLKIREGCKSDKEADRKWDLTDDGINEIGISRTLKRIDKLITALNTLIRLAGDEFKQI